MAPASESCCPARWSYPVPPRHMPDAYSANDRRRRRDRSTHSQIPGVEKRGAEREQRNDNENDGDDERRVQQRAKRSSRRAKRHQIEHQSRKHDESGADGVKLEREGLEQEDKRQNTEEDDRVFDRLRLVYCHAGLRRAVWRLLHEPHPTKLPDSSNTWSWPSLQRTATRSPVAGAALLWTTQRMSAPCSMRCASVSAPMGSVKSTVACRASVVPGLTNSKLRGRMPRVTLLPFARSATPPLTTAEIVLPRTANRALTEPFDSIGPRSASVADSKFICGVPMKLATNMFVGLENNSCGVATCSTLPFCMTAMRSAMISASIWS